jgi:hypothetical protein
MSKNSLVISVTLILIAVISVSVSRAICQETKAPPATNADIEGWVNQLKSHPWEGPKNYTSPIHWMFNFTVPMQRILDAGAPAQDVLLRHLGDPAIKDQVMILLGGVGDAKSIEPIIESMAHKDDINANPEARKINLAANIALTNITAAEVIWHRGGGIPFEQCRDDPKSCWSDWWEKNKDHIAKEMNVDRNYVNYPNYGIYKIK